MVSINGGTFNKYRILSEISKGGMWEVYLAENLKLDRQVAIKFLSNGIRKGTEKLNRLVVSTSNAI